ncbi:hypothetical protein [Desulfobacter curvatus]|uniref:hypothetical protein n=1 Tax=Desulfobacter curvatus TaxID=2290 RepID=UPI000360AF69|nr:hypothetical protein [Desulfobacter curvatus]
MMKRFKTFLFVMVMALAVMTWANWSPAIASGEVDDTVVEETVGQEEEAMENDGAYEEDGQEEWNSQEDPEAETQEESPYTE